MNKIWLLLFACGLLLSASSNCISKFECKPLKTSAEEYSLEITLLSGDNNTYTFELYDLTTGDQVKKGIQSFAASDSKVVFEKVTPSTYAIYYSSSDCSTKKAIPGKGIILR